MPRSKSPDTSASFFALISDIHGNIDALEAVVADMKSWPVVATLCLGDVVGYGPEPAACVQRVSELCVVTVLGNHDAWAMIASETVEREDRSSAGAGIMLAAAQLSGPHWDWLKSLPLTADLDPIFLSHASLADPAAFHYVLHADDVRGHLAAQTTFASFQGHTHLPRIWKEQQGKIKGVRPDDRPINLESDCRYVVNVGSVGQPRDGDPRACYALYDYQSRTLLFRRVPYDLARAQKRCKKAGLPVESAKRLAAGQ